MLSNLNEDNVRSLIIHVADRIIENKPLLTEIDSKIGDGDHGIGMAGGMQKAKDACRRLKIPAMPMPCLKKPARLCSCQWAALPA